MGLDRANWKVLLIGGPSGVGKTIVAAEIGGRPGHSWLQVDDLRLALQYSHATLSHGTDALYFFLRTPDVWRLPPQRLRDALIAVGEVMAPAIEIVAMNHVDTNAPIVIEGDAILPALLDRPAMRSRAADGTVRAVFVREPDESALLTNMVTRNRSMAERNEAEQRREATAKRLFGQWITDEAHRRGVPVVDARPWDTLVERVLAASRS